MRNNAFERAIVFTTVMLFFGLLEAQTTYFVSNQGDDNNNGLSWATAKATINGAMALITSPNDDSVFVAAGTYPACTIKNGTHVYGGFAGTEAYLYERQPLTYGIAPSSMPSTTAITLSKSTVTFPITAPIIADPSILTVFM